MLKPKPKPVIGAANQKGGVGKTSDIRIIAEYLAKYCSKKLLLCDMDSQCSLSARYLKVENHPVTGDKEPPCHPDYDPTDTEQAEWDGKSTIANIFFGEPVIPYKTRIPNIDIAPADEAKLKQVTDIKRSEMAEKVHYQLHKFITLPELQNEYDAFLIDTPPAKDHLTISAFKAMTHLVIPLEMEAMAIEGLEGILTLWKQEALQRPSNYPLHLLGILPSKFHNRRSRDKELYENVRQIAGEHLIPINLVDRTQYPDVDNLNISIFDLPNSNEAKQECLKLGKYIEERVF